MLAHQSNDFGDVNEAIAATSGHDLINRDWFRETSLEIGHLDDGNVWGAEKR